MVIKMITKHENTKNPILPIDVHIPDGEAHVMPDGKLYIYGSLDLPGNEYCSPVHRVVSTADMKNWEIHPIAIDGEQLKWKEDIDISIYPDFTDEPDTPLWKSIVENLNLPQNDDGKFEVNEKGKKLLFAPDAAYHNGEYILYFCTNDSEEGVAFSDKPEGPFTNPIKLPCRGIDPAIFIDEDGKGYYYWGQFYSHAVALNEDMISFAQENVKNWVLTEEEHFFHEGSSMRKIGDTYYAVYACMERGKPTALGYATSKSPLGPFTYQGILIDNDGADPETWNNHGSIECFGGQWYVFYHKSSRNGRNFRRLCIEPITINADGTIDEVPMTSQGIGAPYKPGEEMMAYEACQFKGNLYLDVDNQYGEALGNIADGDKAYYRYVKNEQAYQSVSFTCEGSGTIAVFMNGQLCGTYEIVDGVQTTDEFVVEAGTYEVMLQFSSPSNMKLKKCVMRNCGMLDK
ncbi:MAG: family 43 glycosylhydrolase [Eubacteriales bacterium]